MRKTIAILSLALMTTNPALAYYSNVFESASKLEKCSMLFFFTTAIVGVVLMCVSAYSGETQHCPSNETSSCCNGFVRCHQVTPPNDYCNDGETLLCGPVDEHKVAPFVKTTWYQSAMIASGMVFAVGAVFSIASITSAYLRYKDQLFEPIDRPLVNAV